MSRLDNIRRQAEQLELTGGAPGHPEILELVAVVEAVKAIAEAEVADPWSQETEALSKRFLDSLAPLLAEDGEAR